MCASREEFGDTEKNHDAKGLPLTKTAFRDNNNIQRIHKKVFTALYHPDIHLLDQKVPTAPQEHNLSKQADDNCGVLYVPDLQPNLQAAEIKDIVIAQ